MVVGDKKIFTSYKKKLPVFPKSYCTSFTHCASSKFIHAAFPSNQIIKFNPKEDKVNQSSLDLETKNHRSNSFSKPNFSDYMLSNELEQNLKQKSQKSFPKFNKTSSNKSLNQKGSKAKTVPKSKFYCSKSTDVYSSSESLSYTDIEVEEKGNKKSSAFIQPCRASE
mgnify:CR=1 FL=1